MHEVTDNLKQKRARVNSSDKLFVLKYLSITVSVCFSRKKFFFNIKVFKKQIYFALLFLIQDLKAKMLPDLFILF